MTLPAEIVTVEDVTLAYGSRIILRDLSFSVAPGEIFVILGGSGCGKSTLLRHMIGLYPPARGRILIEGADITEAEGAARIEILKRIGVMYQQGALFGSMSLIENVRLPLEAHCDLPPDAADGVARLMLALVGLGGFEGFRPDQISGGMRKRAAIARAMVLGPRILFLDEPSAGLDPVTSAELDHLILELSQSLGMTFIVVTHELPSIFAIADRCIMLDRETKTIVADGHPATLRDQSPVPAVRRFFNRDPHA